MFQGTSPLCLPAPGKAVQTILSASRKTRAPRSHPALLHRRCAFGITPTAIHPPASPRPTAPWIPGRAAGPRAPGFSVWWGEGGAGPRDVRLPETARQRRPPSEFVKGGAGGDSVRQSPSRAWRGGPRATWEPQIRLGAVGTTRLLRPESPSPLSKTLGTGAQTDLRQL